MGEFDDNESWLACGESDGGNVEAFGKVRLGYGRELGPDSRRCALCAVHCAGQVLFRISSQTRQSAQSESESDSDSDSH